MSRCHWYLGSVKTALRKHMLRVDLRIYIANEDSITNSNDLASSIKSVLTSAIIKGLDVVGIVSSKGPHLGWQARQIALSSGIDVWVIPGQEYQCLDNEKVIVYLLEQPLPPNMNITQLLEYARSKRGFVMAVNVTKRQAQMYNKMSETGQSPHAIELFNEVSGGYLDVHTDLMAFVNSGSQTANELEDSDAYTVVNRKEFEKIGLLPEGQGSDYIPQYLQNTMPKQNANTGVEK